MVSVAFQLGSAPVPPVTERQEFVAKLLWYSWDAGTRSAFAQPGGVGLRVLQAPGWGGTGGTWGLKLLGSHVSSLRIFQKFMLENELAAVAPEELSAEHGEFPEVSGMSGLSHGTCRQFSGDRPRVDNLVVAFSNRTSQCAYFGGLLKVAWININHPKLG